MSAMLEEAIEEVRALPPEAQRQLRERADGLGGLIVVAIIYALLRKEGISLSASDLIEALSLLEKVDVDRPLGRNVALSPVSGRAALSNRIRGKYAHIRTGGDEFAQLKQEEIRREDRRR